jgi:hypothetical protein
LRAADAVAGTSRHASASAAAQAVAGDLRATPPKMLERDREMIGARLPIAGPPGVGADAETRLGGAWRS